MSKFIKYLEEAKEVLSSEQTELRNKVQQHLNHLKEKALSLYPQLAKVKMFNKIKLEYTQDLGDAMAKAWLSLNTIEIELDSLSKHKERMFDEVIGHELCHLLVPMLNKNVGYKPDELHGECWKDIMNKMGFAIDPKDLGEDVEELYEFCNITNKRTGIDNIVIHAYSQGSKRLQHGSRVKVSNVYNKFREEDSFVIDVKTRSVIEGECKLSSKELKKVKEWILLNKKELLYYWEEGTNIGTDEFLDSLTKI